MPDIQQNYASWNESYNWTQQGEEWSQAWGGSESQWYGCLLPRIHRFLPANKILEIAPGYGRWTYYLKDYCQHLVGIDLSSKCIESCKERFQAIPHLEFYCNDGYSLSMVPDNEWDFIFSFDSLVHAEADVMEQYLLQITQKFTPNGVAFLHHSNLAMFPELSRDAPNTALHWRAPSVSAELIRKLINKAGLVCILQELVNWGRIELIDCLTIFTRQGSRFERPFELSENPEFMLEAGVIKKRASLYTFPKGKRFIEEC